MICDVCTQALTLRDGRRATWNDFLGFDLTHHESYGSLEASAKKGCQICLPTWTTFKDTNKPLVTTLHISQPFLDEDLLQLIIYNASDSQSTAQRHVELMASPWEPGECYPPGHLEAPTPFNSDSTGSKEALDKALEWMYTCVSLHQSCRKGFGNLNDDDVRSHAWYPTRLLDVSHERDDGCQVTLILSSEEQVQGRYVSLSHCWGSVMPIRLLKSNIDSFMNGIELEALPKTFQDAIVVTRHLGVRYIWIDSLCIIQDDPSDWSREAALMHRVFSSAVCSISASASTNGSEGLFRKRIALPDPLEPVMIHTQRLREYGDSNIQNLGTYAIIDDGYWQIEVEYTHIHTRGWVLQERILSPRVLFFCDHQIHWECKESRASEFHAKGLPYLSNHDLVDPGYTMNSVKSGHLDPTDMDLDWYTRWEWLVHSFSKTMLTYPEDKLVALAGLANRFSDVLRDEYVVGTWRRFLRAGLLWKTDGYGSYQTGFTVRPKQYRAPSWSCLSIDGKIHPVSTRFGNGRSSQIPTSEFRFEIVGLDLDPIIPDDHFTGVKGGHIDLKGRMVKLRKQPDEWDLKTTSRRVTLGNGKEAFIGFSWDEFSIDQRPQHTWNNRDVYCMLSRIWEDETTLRLVYELLVFDIVNAAEGVYQRVGYAEIRGNGDAEAFLEASGEEAGIPYRNFSGGEHTIRVI